VPFAENPSPRSAWAGPDATALGAVGWPRSASAGRGRHGMGGAPGP
jgi:hypothetical protein